MELTQVALGSYPKCLHCPYLGGLCVGCSHVDVYAVCSALGGLGGVGLGCGLDVGFCCLCVHNTVRYPKNTSDIADFMH